MSGDLTLALRTSQSGLLANQLALNSVANNVANVNSPGYSRRTIELHERIVGGLSAGVEVAAVTRSVDELLMQGLRVEQSRLAGMEARSETLTRLQSLFGAPEDNNSISHKVADFVAAAESLALTPYGHQERQVLLLRGQEIADQLATMTETIQMLRQRADDDLAREVGILDATLATIAELNVKIASAKSVDRDSVGLEDERDQALDVVAELVDIRTVRRDNGSLMVLTTRGQMLVDNTPVPIGHDPAGAVSATATHAGGAFNPIVIGGNAARSDITRDLPEGRLAALVDLRDVFLPALQSSLDELTGNLVDAVNAVHNRGVAFPGLSTMTGSRVFVDAGPGSTHQISLDAMPAGADTVIALLDTNGDQLAATTLRTVMTAATGLADGPWSVDAVADAVEAWLQGASAATAGAQVGFDGNGHLTIELGTATAALAFRDVDGAGNPADLVIRSDSDGDGTIDESVEGFSRFFGLNDFFTDDRTPGTWESDAVDGGFRLAADTTLTVQDRNGSQTVALSAGDDLATIASRITTADIGVAAVLVPDGGGVRLRLTSNSTGSMAVTEGAAGALAAINLHVARVGIAATLGVRKDIVALPARIATGALQFDPHRGPSGQYHVGDGDDTNARALAASLTDQMAFGTAGSIKGTRITLVDYAATLVGTASIETSTLERNLDYQRSLVQALQTESDALRGVNLDEEMSNLVLFEQAYNSAARVITVIREMFETLQNAVS